MKSKTKKPRQKKEWLVVSPDGLPQQERFASEAEANDHIAVFCARYKFQGYYFNANQQRIPLDELPAQLCVMTEHEFFTGESDAPKPSRQVVAMARQLALEYLNTNRTGMNMKPISRIARGWWELYRAEWIALAQKKQA